jgi:hypothetical protein
MGASLRPDNWRLVLGTLQDLLTMHAYVALGT